MNNGNRLLYQQTLVEEGEILVALHPAEINAILTWMNVTTFEVKKSQMLQVLQRLDILEKKLQLALQNQGEVS